METMAPVSLEFFFEDIYRLASEEWRDDLHKASLEDQSVW